MTTGMTGAGEHHSGGLVALARILFAVDTGEMTHELHDAERRFHTTTSAMERDMGHMSRGIVAGSGAFRSLGRSVAFASLGFIGAAGFTHAVKTSVEAADELHDQLERNSAVFKTSANDVEQWSKTTNTAAGLAQSAALDAASTFGTLLQNIGATPAEAARMSKALVQLAADMAAFKKGGATTEQALGALESGIAGRTRGLKQFGIVVTTSTIKQEALRLGLLRSAKDSASSLSDGQRALAVYSAVMRQTNEQQGAFAANSEDLTVKLAVFHASVTNLEAALGGALVPALEDVVDSANEWLNTSGNVEDLQHKVQRAAEDLVHALHILEHVIRQVDDVTGGFDHTLELLLAIKVAEKLGLWAFAFRLLGLSAVEAGGGTMIGLLITKLRELLAFGAIKIGFLFPGLAEGLATIAALEGTFLAAGAAAAAILITKGDQGPGPPSDPHLGEGSSGKDFPVLHALGKSFDFDFHKAPHVLEIWNQYRAGNIDREKAEERLEAQRKELAAGGLDLDVVPPAVGKTGKGALPESGEHIHAGGVTGSEGSGLAGDKPSGKPPKAKDVTSTPWLDYQTELAKQTKTNADDEQLLRSRIGVLRRRANSAKKLDDKTKLEAAISAATSELDGLLADDAQRKKAAADELARRAAERKRLREARRQKAEQNAQLLASAEQNAGDVPTHLELQLALAQGTKTTKDDVVALHAQERVLERRLRTGTVTYKDADGKTRTAPLDDSGRLAIVQRLNDIHTTLKQIAENTAPLLTLRQRQGFIESLSGVLGSFASDTTSIRGASGHAGGHTFHLDLRGRDMDPLAALREARLAAEHVPV